MYVSIFKYFVDLKSSEDHQYFHCNKVEHVLLKLVEQNHVRLEADLL